MASSGYIQFPIVTDTNVILQTALRNLITSIPGWTPREGNLEVHLIEQFAQIAAEAANVASDVPKSIFRYFGQLVDIVPKDGVNAQIQTLWTLVNTAPTGGYLIPAGTVAGFYYNGIALQYQTMEDVTIDAGGSSASIKMESLEPGSQYNIDSLNITAIGTFLTPAINTVDVANIKVTATPATNSSLSIGEDAETDDAYLDRLSSELRFLAPRPITANDYSKLSQNITGVYRAATLDAFNPFTNLLNSSNANTGPQTGGSWSWSAVGDGSHNPTVTNPTSSTPMTITASSTAYTSTYITTATTAGATSLIVKGQIVFGTPSTSAPVFVYIDDNDAGQEVAMVTGVTTNGSGSGTTYTLTIGGAGLKYAHSNVGSTGIFVYPLQGVKLPTLSGLASNSRYYQLAASVKRGDDTATTVTPFVVGVVTYNDNTTAVYSSANRRSETLYDYTSWQKTVIAEIPATNSASLAPGASAPYSTIHQNATSVQCFILWQGATASKKHLVYGVALNQCRYDFATGSEFDLDLPTSLYNFLVDSDFSAYTPSANMSWNVPSGNNLVVLPGYGIQYQSPGTAVATAFNVDSQIFNLSNVSVEGTTVSTTRTYTVFAYVDLSYTDTTYNKFTLKVVDASNTSTVLVTATPVNASLQLLTATFDLTAPKDVQVRLAFDAGLTVPYGSSVIVSSLGIVSGSYNNSSISVAGGPVNDYHSGFSWTPGDLYVTNAYIAPRSVSVIPLASTGLPVASEVADDLTDYLEKYREVNFQVYSIIPNYVPINVQWTATVSPGYSTSDVTTAGNSAIRSYLSPANWAGGTNSPPTWDATKKSIGVLDIAGVLGKVAGIASVTSVQLAVYKTSGTTMGTVDINMNGIAPLPVANVITGTVYANTADAALGSI